MAKENENDVLNDLQSMDDALYHRLLEIIPTFPSEALPMDIGKFFQSHVAAQNGDLDCRKSRYGSVSKWMKEMERERLVLMKKVGKKGPARIVAVGPSQVALFRSHGKKPGLTAANLAKHSTATSGEADDISLDDSSSDKCHDEVKSIAISEAMSMATTTFSIATTDYNIQPTIHAKQRQHQRGIHRREIQSAVKSHAVATRARDGRRLIHGENGVAVVVSGGEKNTVITTWRENEGDDPTESWKAESEFETKVLLSARVIRMFPFLFPTDNRARAAPMDDTAVLKACIDYFESPEYGKGRLRGITYLVTTMHEWLHDNSRKCNQLTPQKRVSLYITIIDLLKSNEEIDGNEEVIQLFGERGSQRFWNVLNPGLDDSGDRQLKHKIKELVRYENATKKTTGNIWKEQFRYKILLQSDSSVARTPESLADLVMKLSTTCHCVVGGSEWRDGSPPIVTIGDYFERYTQGKRGVWKAGDIVVKHRKRKKRVMIVGMQENAINSAVDTFRRIPHCTCSIKTLDYAYWTSLFGEYVDPMAKEGSRTVVLQMSEGSEALVSVMQSLGEFVPQEYRRYVSEEDETVETQPQAQPLVEQADDIYQHMIQESASIELTEIYRMHAPEKIADIPRLLKKYSGREEKLLKVVRTKYIASASRLNAVPETRAVEKEEDNDEDTTNENHVIQAQVKKEPILTWETDDFSAFL